MNITSAGNRIIAALFDFFIMVALCLIAIIPAIISFLSYLNDPAQVMNTAALFISAFVSGALVVVVLVIYLVVLPVFLSGQSLGKRFFHIRIICTNGKELDFRTMFTREMIHILFIVLTIGLVSIVDLIILISSKNKQSFYDVLASTCVIDVI